jgi:hypothetical protein
LSPASMRDRVAAGRSGVTRAVHLHYVV